MRVCVANTPLFSKHHTLTTNEADHAAQTDRGVFDPGADLGQGRGAFSARVVGG